MKIEHVEPVVGQPGQLVRDAVHDNEIQSGDDDAQQKDRCDERMMCRRHEHNNRCNHREQKVGQHAASII